MYCRLLFPLDLSLLLLGAGRNAPGEAVMAQLSFCVLVLQRVDDRIAGGRAAAVLHEIPHHRVKVAPRVEDVVLALQLCLILGFSGLSVCCVGLGVGVGGLLLCSLYARAWVRIVHATGHVFLMHVWEKVRIEVLPASAAT